MIRELQIQIPAEAARAVDGLVQLPRALLEQVRTTVDAQNQLTVTHVQARKLSRRGPRTLGVISDRLRGSLRRTDAQIRGEAVEGAVGSNVRYFGVHEFGFDGEVQVRAHRAKNAATDVLLIAGGRRIRRWELIGSGAKRARQVASGTVLVRAHTRRVKFPARAMLATGIEERTPEIGRALGAAVQRVFP